MSFFFCLPIVFGCPTKIKQEGDPSPRICPRCRNASVFAAKARTWFELCFIPLIPLTSNHIWKCSICQWEVSQKQPSGWEPSKPGWGHHLSNVPPPTNPGYQPAYIHQSN